MRSLKDSVLLELKRFWLSCCQGLVPLYEIINRYNDHVLDIFYKGIDERGAYILNAALDPNIVMQEISLTSKYTEMDSEAVIVTVHYCQKTIFDFLGDI